MPDNKFKSSEASFAVTMIGCILLFGSTAIPVHYPRVSIGMAIAIGATVGIPFIILGLLLDPKSTNADGTEKHFWPTKAEMKRVAWGFVAIMTLQAVVLGPAAIVVSVGYLLPSGDTWDIVAVRLAFVVVSALGGVWWFKFTCKTIPSWFRGKLSDKTLDTFIHVQPTEEPATAMAAAKKRWKLVVVALAAFSVALGAIDITSAWLDMDVVPKRAFGLYA
jgi:hypothetical protein